MVLILFEQPRPEEKGLHRCYLISIIKKNNKNITSLLYCVSLLLFFYAILVEILLGSCVSVSIWHRETKIGAISHSIRDTRNKIGVFDLDSKYCDEAIILMLQELKFKGIHIKECEAKIFGGASLIPCMNMIKIGEKNYQKALSIVNGYDIPIVSSDVLGKLHRKILFDINTGYVACEVH